MSPIFNKKRRANITKKFGIYSLYALGEVCLIVVGILIAMSLNNWNQERNTQKKIENLLQDYINYGSNRAGNIRSYKQFLINKKETIENYFNENYIDSLNSTNDIIKVAKYKTQSPVLIDNSISSIMPYINDMPKEYKYNVGSSIELYISYVEKINASLESYNAIANENKSIIKSEANFLLNDSEESFQKQMSLLKNNYQIKNNLLYQKDILGSIIYMLTYIDVVNEGVYYNIDYILNENRGYNLEDELNESGYHKFKAITNKEIDSSKIKTHPENKSDNYYPIILLNQSETEYFYTRNKINFLLKPGFYLPDIGEENNTIQLINQETQDTLQFLLNQKSYLVLE